MALTRYTKQYRDKNDATITVTGATFELDNPADKWGGLSAAIYEETEQYKLDIADFPGGFRLNPYSIPYYYDKGYHFNVMEYTSKGTGKSFSEFIEACASILREKIVAGNTGEWKSSQYSDLCSKGQTTLKSYSSNYCGHIELKLYILVNKVVAASTAIPEHREVNAGIEFFYGSSTWNSSGNRWNSLEGSTIRFTSLRMNNVSRPSEGGTTEIDYMLSQLPAMALSIKDCYLSPGPNNVYTESSGLITFNSVVKNQERWYIYAKGHPMMNQSDVPFLISGWDIGRIGTPNWLEDGEVDPEDPWIEPDPYDPVPKPPKPPGPTPDPTPIEDPIPIPALPPISGANVGIYKAFVPNSSQLREIATKLWDPSAIEMIKQMFTNPMEAILGLAIVPVNPVQGSSQPVYLGRYNTQVSVPVVASDYVTVDCGSVAIKKFYGSYLDHDPYTKYTIYLPYIGEMELNADEITGRVMNVVYHCNVITGDIVALIALDGRVCYTGMGNFIRQLPLSQTDYSSIIQTAVSAASVLLTTAVAGAGGAAVAGAAGAGTMAEVRAQARVASTVANGSTSLLSDVLNTKYNYKHAGKIGQGAGQLGVQKPFITINRPNLALPENNNLSQQSNLKAYTGYPCNKIVQLSSCHGFTQVEACKLSVPSATDEEIAEIYSLLKGGVLL